jgi:hypothetical protein
MLHTPTCRNAVVTLEQASYCAVSKAASANITCSSMSEEKGRRRMVRMVRISMGKHTHKHTYTHKHTQTYTYTHIQWVRVVIVGKSVYLRSLWGG